MAKKKKTTEDLLKDLLIVQLAQAGLSQPDIQKIVGCDMNYVSQIARYLKVKKK